ncbi:hypothetical protein QMO56_21000 [Roseomonas sp. E05]|uniref:hypothetical protein n=1 Tax=Roseomonas sp. E05 TaxID=3046310 RepID=UPI0024B8D552|nr:hypothetical protein [Roseomonas sp. E05]MDJ0390595.1 hypothetical protein [Roseomonas sp. E05]
MKTRDFLNGAAPGLAEAEECPRERPKPPRGLAASALWKTRRAQAGAAPLWCEACLNTGVVDCYCGGDLCVCECYGTAPCPACGGLLAWADEAAPGQA